MCQYLRGEYFCPRQSLFLEEMFNYKNNGKNPGLDL